MKFNGWLFIFVVVVVQTTIDLTINLICMIMMMMMMITRPNNRFGQHLSRQIRPYDNKDNFFFESNHIPCEQVFSIDVGELNQIIKLPIITF